jgi:ankyrin repeat protein
MELGESDRAWIDKLILLQEKIVSITLDSLGETHDFVQESGFLASPFAIQTLIREVVQTGLPCAEESKHLVILCGSFLRNPAFSAEFFNFFFVPISLPLFFRQLRFLRCCLDQDLFQFAQILPGISNFVANFTARKGECSSFLMWFGPELEKSDQALFTTLVTLATAFVASCGSGSSIGFFVSKLNFMSQWNWEGFRRLLQNVIVDPIAHMFERDDIIALNQFISCSEGNLKYSVWMNPLFTDGLTNRRRSLVEAAAKHGAIKCLKYLVDAIGVEEFHSSLKAMDSRVWMTTFEICRFWAESTNDIQPGLVAAIETHKYDFFRWLLLNHAHKIDSRSTFAALLQACVVSNNLKILKLVQRLGAERFESLGFEMLLERVEALKLLLTSENMDINKTDSAGKTLMGIAMEQGKLEIARLLLHHPKIKVDGAIIGDAIRHKAIDIVQYLAARDLIDLSTVIEGQTVLQLLGELDDISIVQIMLSKLREEQFSELLSGAARNNNIDLVKLILAQDFEFRGFFPLHVAASKGYSEVVRILTEDRRFSNVNQLDDQGMSALHIAVSCNFLYVARVLIEANCELNVCDDLGSTPLHLALELGQLDVIPALLECESIDINRKNRVGFTPLHLGAANGRVEAVRIILNDHRIDPTIPNVRLLIRLLFFMGLWSPSCSQMLPLDLASTHGFDEIVGLLREFDNK